jgi:TonB family protein
LLIGTLALIAIFALPRLFRHQPKAGPNAPAPVARSTSDGTSTNAGSNSSTKTATPAPSGKSQPPIARRATDENNNAQPPAKSANSGNAAVLPPTTSAESPAANSSGGSPEKGEVLNQVLPTASQSALASIHGTVRVTVRAQVDAVGRVSNAELFSPGPSKYFADRALVAARQWEFTSPESNGHSMPSEWMIRFEFSQAGPKAYPTQTAP